ncbi:hypothetical protein [Weissella soli]|uniref:hypothetical protein n=1 Tax=Weissella soli TaxID=155866 RepID=UPI0035A16593
MAQRRRKQVNNHGGVRVGRDFDAAASVQTDVSILDLRAPVFQTYVSPVRHQKVLVQFKKHTETVSRGTWQQFIQQEVQKVTDPQVELVTVQSSRVDEGIFVVMVGRQTAQFRILRIASGPAQHELKFDQLQTQFLADAAEVGQWTRKWMTNQGLQSFTFRLYTTLRWWLQPTGQQLERHGKHWLVAQGDQYQAVHDEDTLWLDFALSQNLLNARNEPVRVTDLGIALVNYFARFYEAQFEQQYGENGIWREGDVLTHRSAQTAAKLQPNIKRTTHFQLPKRKKHI